jgi:hypothetical protein
MFIDVALIVSGLNAVLKGYTIEISKSSNMALSTSDSPMNQAMP